MKNINLFLILFSFAILSFSQSNNEGVAINTSGALNDPSSMLDISSTSKGILIPRMTEAQKLSINNPATGLLIYQTDNNEGFWYYDGSKWTSILNSQVITGLLPQGVTGQTLRHDGTNWVNNSFLYNAGNSIGIGTNSPDMSSILDIISYDKGVLIPRLTDSLRDKIINPAKGLLIFNTTTNCLNIRRENYWSEICGEPTICCYKWPYKVDVIVNNSGNSNVLTDHQVCVTINHSSLVLSGKSNASGSDFFVADKNCKPLNFWVNPTTLNTSSCEIWVKVPYIQASSSNGASFSIYYGNLSATPKSNGDSTFIFYDDFNNINDGNPPNSLKWAWKGITPTVTNGRLRVRNLIAQKPVGPAHVIEGDVICTATAGNHDFRVNVLISTPDPNLYNTTGYYYYQYLIPWEGGDSRIDRFTNGAAGCNPCLTPCSPNNTGGPKYTNYAFRIITYSPGPSQLQSLEAYNITNNVILKSISCTHQAHGDYFGFSAPDDSRSSTVDNVRVRKWANPQPSVTVSPEILNFIP